MKCRRVGAVASTLAVVSVVALWPARADAQANTAAAMVQAVREPVDGVRLDRYLELEVRVGRPFWAREE